MDHGRPQAALRLAPLFAAALLVRWPGIGGPLWLDEIASLVTYFRLPAAEIAGSYITANHHVLYSLLAHGAIGLFGESAWAVRLPALLFGAAAVPALYLLAAAALDRREALAAALLLCLSYPHAYFSQNARGYTGMIFFALLGTWLLGRALEENRRRLWLAWAVAGALGSYLLLTGLVVCVAQVAGGVAVGLRSASREERRRRLGALARWTAVAALLTLALYGPMLGSLFEFYAAADVDFGWRPSLELLGLTLRQAAPHPLAAIAAVVALPVGAAGLVGLWRRAPLIVLALGLPAFLQLAVELGLGAGTYPRRFLLLLPLGLLAGVRGLSMTLEAIAGRFRRPRGDPPTPGRVAPAEAADSRRPRAGGSPGTGAGKLVFWVAVALGAVVGAAGLPRLYTLPKQDYPGALAAVAARRAPGDLMAAAYVTDVGARFYDPTVVSARTEAELGAILAEGRPVWLLGTFLGDMRTRAPELAELIDRRFVEVQRLPGLVGDGDLVIWRSR